MKHNFLALFLSVAYLFSSATVWAENDEEFEMRRRVLEDRFEDYYTRQILLERAEMEREKGINEKKSERVREDEERERIRKQFVIERQKQVQPDPKMYEKELLERKKEYEKNREEFVRRMQTLKRIERDISIPGEEELGINLESESL